MKEESNKYQAFCVYLVLASVTFIVYAQTLHHEFVKFDDDKYVTENPNVQAGLTFRSIKWAFTATEAANWHPLTWLSHIIDCRFFGLNPKWHHLVNLLFHTANALLLFCVLKDMTGALWRSAFVAGLFALHPLHVESVAWVAERKDVLSTLFWLLTMAGYVRYARGGGAKWYMVTLLLFALGLMAKPMLVTLPFVLLLLDYWPLNRLTRHTIFEKLPFFILSAISSVITFFVQLSAGAVAHIDFLPLSIRIANTPVSYVKYVMKLVWPDRLAVFYPYRSENLSFRLAAAAALVLLSVSILVLRLASRHRYLPVGWFWYLGTLVPVIGLVQVGDQALADRYTYIPLTGLFIIVAWGLPELLAGWRHRKVVPGISAAAVLFALSICTYHQLHYWRNNITLFEHTLAVTDNNSKIQNNLGNVLASGGRFDEAVSHYNEALRIKPDYATAHYNLAQALKSQGRIDEAISHYNEALYIKPDYADAHINLGIILKSAGKVDEAISHYRQALQIKPDSAEAYYNLGNALKSQGKLDEASSNYEKALQFNPNDAETCNNIGSALQSQGKLNEAINYYRRSVTIDPNYAPGHNNLGNALASAGRLDEAIAHIERAAALTRHQNAAILNTLAAAYAAKGRFDEATATAQKALDISVADKNTDLADRSRKQLELYRQKKSLK
jgi:tetratricopeptide (TPR) repeat protein